ncbi:hypothetical protein PGTUg99_012456 [Puccinia graminis f. sp. tritici]|uniref:Uncharacterized protein n=1 Tax=Puccinia graminis f. sp. tritici TaxID=56615 RepID=A0A5B0PPA0_PUCGR|nr:hypothetical protein PGTUg99_012456 [Puccinia graminis f. sp. tritici]
MAASNEAEVLNQADHFALEQLVGRNPSRRAGLCTSSPGGIPPGGVASLGTGYPLGYPDIRQVWAEKQPSAAESAPAGGYPPADSGYSRRIIRDHLYVGISFYSNAELQLCKEDSSFAGHQDACTATAQQLNSKL